MQKTLLYRLRAFTLVELVVVIGIIAILMGLLLPSLSRARQAASSLACMSNLKTIGQALNMYCNDNKGILPPCNYQRSSPGQPWYTFAVDYYMLLSPYVGGPQYSNFTEAIASGASASKVFLCPDAPPPTIPTLEGTTMTYGSSGGGTWNGNQYVCHPRVLPCIREPDGQPDYARPRPGGGYAPMRCVKLSSIRRSAEIAAIFDGALSTTWSLGAENVAPPNAWRLDNIALWWGDPISSQPSTNLTDNYTTASGMSPMDPVMPGNNVDGLWDNLNIRFRHKLDKEINVLMLDGHVESFLYKSNTESTLLRKNINVNLSN